MDLRDFGTTLARWWYLAIATLLLAIGAGIGMYKAAGPTYTANSTVLLLPPKAVLVQAQEDKKNYAPNNPLLYLSSLTDARDVLVRHLSSTDVTDELAKKAPDATLTVTGDLTSGSPLILVKSEGPTEKAALDGMKAVDDMVPGTLKSLQDEMKIADLQRINSLEVTEDTKATPESKKQIMSGAVGFAGVTLLGLAAIAVLDQRRNRRQGDDESDDTTRTADEAKKAGSTAVRTQRAVKAGKRA